MLILMIWYLEDFIQIFLALEVFPFYLTKLFTFLLCNCLYNCFMQKIQFNAKSIGSKYFSLLRKRKQSQRYHREKFMNEVLNWATLTIPLLKMDNAGLLYIHVTLIPIDSLKFGWTSDRKVFLKLLTHIDVENYLFHSSFDRWQTRTAILGSLFFFQRPSTQNDDKFNIKLYQILLATHPWSKLNLI